MGSIYRRSLIFYPPETGQLKVLITLRPRVHVLGQGGGVTTRVEVLVPLA
jgi:hypothetical protein